MNFNSKIDFNYVQEHFCTFLISLLPICFFFGSGVGNLFVIILDIVFILILFKSKKIDFLHSWLFYFLLIFWLILMISLFFSINVSESLFRSFGFLRFIILVFAIQYFFKESNLNYKTIILNTWSILIIIITLDLIFEFLFGYNTLGYNNPMPGRLSSFFDQELKIGHLYSAFFLFFASYFSMTLMPNNNFCKNYLIFFMLTIFLIMSLIIGERSTIIKVFLMSFLFMLSYKKNIILKINIMVGIISFLIILMIFNVNYQWRYWQMLIKPAITDPISYINNSTYTDHYRVAIEVFKNNKIYGVGLKNYRHEVQKDKYHKNASIHPHQIHFEILAELGLIGYIFFIFFMLINLYFALKSFLRKKNYLVFSGFLFILASFVPLLPSGSFFTSFGATMFWINFAIMTSDIDIYKKLT
jgi:O-antigen ligase